MAFPGAKPALVDEAVAVAPLAASATFVRSPGDKPCPLGDTFRKYDLAPADQAFQLAAAMFPDLVTVAPKVHVDSCDDYNNHPPHLQLAGPASRAAMKMGAIYKDSASQ